MNPDITIEMNTGGLYTVSDRGRVVYTARDRGTAMRMADTMYQMASAHDKFNWIADIYTSAEKEETPRPKRVFKTGIDDAIDAVDLATIISKREGVPVEAKFNDKTGHWFVVEK